jgi:hypothetical protein
VCVLYVFCVLVDVFKVRVCMLPCEQAQAHKYELLCAHCLYS